VDKNTIYEVEFLDGLAPFVLEELVRFGAVSVKKKKNAFRFETKNDPEALYGMRTVVAGYRFLQYDISRPRALLGDQHLQRLVEAITEVSSSGDFNSFRFGAAGSNSEVFQRLAGTLRSLTRLRFDPDKGDLVIRIRRGPSNKGWEVLLRLSPRPLSARPWRVCNLSGGLNATVAVAVNTMLGISPSDRYLNAMLGSGTILIERALAGPSACLVGCDCSSRALDCARQNLRAADLGDIELLNADATSLPVSDGSFDVVSVDLPWGDAVGRFNRLTDLYPAFLAEMWRVVSPGGRIAVISHDLKRFDAFLKIQTGWREKHRFQVFHGGHHPRVYLLERY
jgi:tRNA (guanine6-N2)-methyltransferase